MLAILKKLPLILVLISLRWPRKIKNYTTYFKNPHRYIKSVILKWVAKSWSWSWPKVKKVNSIFKKLLQDSWSRWQFFKILISGAFEVQGRFLRSRCQLLKVVVYFWSYWRSFKIKIIHFLKILETFLRLRSGCYFWRSGTHFLRSRYTFSLE